MNLGQHQEAFLITLLVALSLGIVAGWAFPALPFSILIVVMSGLFVWAVFSIYRSSMQVWPAFLMLLFVLGVLRIQASVMISETDISHFAGKQLHITGILTEAPQIRERNDGSISVRYRLKAEQIKQGKNSVEPVSGGLYIYARSDKEKLEAMIAYLEDNVKGEPPVKGNKGTCETCRYRFCRYYQKKIEDLPAWMKRRGIER